MDIYKTYEKQQTLSLEKIVLIEKIREMAKIWFPNLDTNRSSAHLFSRQELLYFFESPEPPCSIRDKDDKVVPICPPSV